MNSPDAAAAIHNHVRAFDARDLDALLAGFTDDARWVTGSSTVSGRAAFAVFFAEAMAGLLPALTVQTLLTDGDRAACQLTETLTVDGAVRTFSIAAFYVLRGGRIASAKVYREGSAEIA